VHSSLQQRLIVAFVALAVVPLVAVVAFNYFSSLRAFHRAAETEGRELADQLNRRMGFIRRDLAGGLTRACEQVGSEGHAWPERTEAAERVLAELGRVSSLVQAVEWVPAVAPVVPQAGDGPAPPSPPTPAAIVLEVSRQLELARRGAEEARAAKEHELHLLEEAARAHDEALRAVAEAALEAARSERPRRVHVRTLSPDELAELERRRERSELILGERLEAPVLDGDLVVGRLSVSVQPRQVLAAVLADAERGEGEIPFAIDRDGVVYAANPADEAKLEDLPRGADGSLDAKRLEGSWVVAQALDPASGVRFGIARPVGKALAEIRRAAATNLLWGLGVVAVAAAGVVPASRRMTRDLRALTHATESLAEGHLTTRVPVTSTDEIGRLAEAFNRMAGELEEHQQQLLEAERARQEQASREHLLEAENRRRGRELDAAREFQLSMLPRQLPDHSQVEIAVRMRTATEVGGDYYDFRVAPDGTLVGVIGDATGHGAAAGTMVTVVKSLFTAAADPSPAGFLADAAHTVRSMDLGRMMMALAMFRVTGRELSVASAAMPPLLVHRAATGSVDEVLSPGLPLGALDNPSYGQLTVLLQPGDTVLLMTDGFPELLDPDGEPFGYDRVRDTFADGVSAPVFGLIAHLEASADRWRRSRPQEDDMTFVALRVRSASESFA